MERRAQTATEDGIRFTTTPKIKMEEEKQDVAPAETPIHLEMVAKSAEPKMAA